ncbi:MAG TPA: ATP-dependent RecD-like DNA helicase [Candidatus Pelethousia gallinarum]|nr:ATP-dependent RecD-like DNA helicase [Candidatus Pelethousia gallinarum]
MLGRMELTGTVKAIIYRSEDTGFTVLELTDETGEDMTAIGEMPLAGVGERVELTGQWTEHKTYGHQFRAETCKTLAPATLTALKNYLASGLIKGVGESIAQAIVQTFGMETLDVLEKEPARLAEVPGIGQIRAQTIGASYGAQLGLRDIMLGLQKYGVTIGQAMKLYKIYGELCLAKIEENPYRLIDDVEGIGFKTADAIARNGGVEPDAPYRLRAGLKYTLQWARQEGHTYLPREKLVEVAAGLLQADIAPVERTLTELLLEGQLIQEQLPGEDGIFLPGMFRTEQDCALRLLRLQGQSALDNPFFRPKAQIARLEQQLDITLAPAQRQAVELALKAGALVITGGPGTGKTTILRFVITLLEEMGTEYALCAPTGRAAKRMGEATGRDASTIHRLLEYSYGEGGFGRNAENTLLADVVIVDEMSMVDVPLMAALLRALAPGTRLIMVGDSDQLPSVGPGNVLRDMVDSGQIPVVRLTEIFRQSGRSAIVTNAHRINEGQMPILEGLEDFGFEPMEEQETVIRRLIALNSGKAAKLGAQEPLQDIQVLAPMKKGPLGVYNLNKRLQEALNPPAHKKKERKYGDVVFREGDKVMQIKNDYRLAWTRSLPHQPPEMGEGVYNGDLGTIMSIDLYDQTLEVLFDDGRSVVYSFSMLEELELAYCISIHKSQGSEFPIVLLPLLGGPPMLLNRNLLYTAVTRARHMVCILGRQSCIQQMVRNNQVKRRYSGLARFLCRQKELLP